MPQEYDGLFNKYVRFKIIKPVQEAPQGAKAIIVSQNRREGPFFPLHAAIIDPDDRTKIRHRPGTATDIEIVEISSFIEFEIAKDRE